MVILLSPSNPLPPGMGWGGGKPLKSGKACQAYK